jgi:hypothetical protein
MTPQVASADREALGTVVAAMDEMAASAKGCGKTRG